KSLSFRAFTESAWLRYTSSHVNDEIGYAFAPEAFTIDTRKSVLGGSLAPSAAAEIEAIVGSTYRPAALRMFAYCSLFCFTYASSVYPIAYGVCLTWPETPSLPFAPTPVGHFTSLPLPTVFDHSGLTAARKSVKTYVVPLPSDRW